MDLNYLKKPYFWIKCLMIAITMMMIMLFFFRSLLFRTESQPLSIISKPIYTKVKAGEAYRYDEDNKAEGRGAEPLFWVRSEDAPLSFSIDAQGVIDWRPQEPGEFEVGIRLVDSKGKMDKQIWKVKVLSKPFVINPGILYCEIKKDFSYQLRWKAFPTDVEFNLEKGPEKIRLGKKNGKLTWKPDHAGTYPIIVSAVNSVGQTSISTQIIVKDKIPPKPHDRGENKKKKKEKPHKVRRQTAKNKKSNKIKPSVIKIDIEWTHQKEKMESSRKTTSAPLQQTMKAPKEVNPKMKEKPVLTSAQKSGLKKNEKTTIKKLEKKIPKKQLIKKRSPKRNSDNSLAFQKPVKTSVLSQFMPTRAADTASNYIFLNGKKLEHHAVKLYSIQQVRNVLEDQRNLTITLTWNHRQTKALMRNFSLYGCRFAFIRSEDRLQSNDKMFIVQGDPHSNSSLEEITVGEFIHDFSMRYMSLEDAPGSYRYRVEKALKHKLMSLCPICDTYEMRLFLSYDFFAVVIGNAAKYAEEHGVLLYKEVENICWELITTGDYPKLRIASLTTHSGKKL